MFWLWIACNGGGGPDAAFVADIHPVLRAECADCHANDAPITPEIGPGFFGDADPARAYADVLTVIRTEDPDASLLLLKLVADPASPDGRMPPPPAEPLPSAFVAELRAWIAAQAEAN